MTTLQIVYRVFDAVMVAEALDALHGRTPEVTQVTTPALLFNVSGSAGKLYTVKLSVHDGEALASCYNNETYEDCQALQYNGYCYHLGAVFQQLSIRQTLLLLDDTVAGNILLLDDTVAGNILLTLTAIHERLAAVEARLLPSAARGEY